ncbi:Anaerobic respiratory complex protein QmoA [hydrothermal vent metagenome]|uniref:Anaerobic respiratory complex protein QmoA n=1 Tax=hydrothermal vent metagenome TaxID=652676 RepID=A0A3B1AAJ0_9ZZZZ
MSDIVATNETILVVGGGISGMTAAIEAAECGKQVILVEKSAAIGGRVSRLYKYFPKMCHPSCGMEINQRRLMGNNNIHLLTMTQVSQVTGDEGNYSVTLNTAPRFVNENCTACGDCADAVDSEIKNEQNYGLNTRKAAYIPSAMAYPQRYVLDPSIIGSDEATKAKDACQYNAIDLEMAEVSNTINVGAIIWATGWRPYDAAKIQAYGYDRISNVITSVEFERLADPHGPTGGKLLRPSDGAQAKNIAFIQCAGSRDRNHLQHCSRICCMASLKHTHYVQDAYGDDGKSTIYYIDIRAIDRIDDFHQKVKDNKNVTFVKSKVARIDEDKTSGNPILRGVDTEGYNRYDNQHDLVVLAVGMEPSVASSDFPIQVKVNVEGFIEQDESNGGIFAAGCASDALDVNRAVQSATASALRAIQVVNRVARAEG